MLFGRVVWWQSGCGSIPANALSLFSDIRNQMCVAAEMLREEIVKFRRGQDSGEVGIGHGGGGK